MTRYYVRVRFRTGRELVRTFETPLLRTLFILGMEGHGLGTIVSEWEAPDGV